MKSMAKISILCFSLLVLSIIGFYFSQVVLANPDSTTYDYSTGAGTDKWAFVSPDALGNYPPTWGEGWLGTQLISQGYTNISTDNGVYSRQPGGANTEPYYRFNITLAQSSSIINWIHIRINGYSTFDGGEDADCFIANFLTSSWDYTCQMPTGDGNCDYNLTSDFANYLNAQNQIVYLCYGKNLDSNDDIFIDYVRVIVDYTLDTSAPKFSNCHQNVTNNTMVSIGTPIYLGCQWTDNKQLSMYVNSTKINNSGSWTNGTWQTFTAGNWSNFTIIFPSEANSNITIKIYANDTAGNQNVTGTWFWWNQYTPCGGSISNTTIEFPDASPGVSIEPIVQSSIIPLKAAINVSITQGANCKVGFYAKDYFNDTSDHSFNPTTYEKYTVDPAGNIDWGSITTYVPVGVGNIVYPVSCSGKTSPFNCSFYFNLTIPSGQFPSDYNKTAVFTIEDV